MSKSTFEICIMLMVTGITNFLMIPAVILLHRQSRPFQAFIGAFTMLTSFMYHCCDSIDKPLWLSEGQWHRLDNVGSIMSFIMWLVYLMDIPDQMLRGYILYGAFGIVLILQEKAPWDERYTVLPILSFLGLLICTCIGRRKVPPYNYFYMRRGLFFLGLGFICFIRGLDDKTDPFRFFHGCWHGCVGISAYFDWKILPRDDNAILPQKYR